MEYKSPYYNHGYASAYRIKVGGTSMGNNLSETVAQILLLTEIVSETSSRQFPVVQSLTLTQMLTRTLRHDPHVTQSLTLTQVASAVNVSPPPGPVVTDALVYYNSPSVRIYYDMPVTLIGNQSNFTVTINGTPAIIVSATIESTFVLLLTTTKVTPTPLDAVVLYSADPGAIQGSIGTTDYVARVVDDN